MPRTKTTTPDPRRAARRDAILARRMVRARMGIGGSAARRYRGGIEIVG